MMTLRTSFAVLAFTALLSSNVRADDVFTDAMNAAYAPYRAALFRTNGRSQTEAQQALAQAQQAWAAMGERFAAKPPVPYDRDPAFSATLTQVGSVYNSAAGEIAAGKLAEAHETLEKVRDLVAALRQRNGVIVFSDHMNAYHAEMERLLAEGPKLLGTPQGLAQIAAQSGVLDYLARQLRARAPLALRQNGEFDTLLRDVEQSTAAVLRAAVAQDGGALQDAVGKLKAPYSRLFLKFG